MRQLVDQLQNKRSERLQQGGENHRDRQPLSSTSPKGHVSKPRCQQLGDDSVAPKNQCFSGRVPAPPLASTMGVTEIAYDDTGGTPQRALWSSPQMQPRETIEAHAHGASQRLAAQLRDMRRGRDEARAEVQELKLDNFRLQVAAQRATDLEHMRTDACKDKWQSTFVAQAWHDFCDAEGFGASHDPSAHDEEFLRSFVSRHLQKADENR
eukprot:gnl/TRDRNA2_/TRDRNA2_173404_c1_seq19.p1 gnl/TRDRNA2_/TRDRNA2_173404_c1~~gnl/TRDRNA2_/TRDRNA2_173404_c1_seq19.p1  ORF type:complete len:210 (-),score=44.31 gnl/TRDRNA2_/TRDRNA2_173404_c1_seq19:224-853(-)